MYCVPHPALLSLLDLSRVQSHDNESILKFIDEFLKGLAVLGTPKMIITGIRRHLQVIGAVDEVARKGATSLESILRRHDLLLGPELGGFGNLFRSAMDNHDVFSGDHVDFEGLDPDFKNQLQPIGDAFQELSILDDLLLAFDLRAERLAACLVLDGIARWTSQEVVAQWMRGQSHLENARRLFELRDRLNYLSAEFIQRELDGLEIREFSLWLLVSFLAGKVAFGPLERRLVDTLLKKAELASLATFEHIGLG